MFRLVFRLFMFAVIISLVVLYAGTFWAIGKSRDRTECYRHAKTTTDCEQPGQFEQLIRRWSAP